MLENMEPKYRMLILAGLIVGGVLAVVGLSYVLMSRSHSSSPSSGPQHDMPDTANMKSSNIATGDHTNMVNARGYFFQYDVGFIPIVVTGLENVADKESKLPGAGQLIMKSDQATLTLDYVGKTADGKTNLMTLGLELPSGDDKKTHKKICDVVPAVNVKYDPTKYFACTRREVRSCVDQANPKERVGELVLESLEVELGGDPKVLAEGKFSKEPYNGCTL